MSHLENEAFFAEEDMELAEAMAQYGDDKRILHSLLSSVGEDTPDLSHYSDALTAQIQATAESFGCFVLEIHQSYSLDEALPILTELAKNEDIDRVALLNLLTDTEIIKPLDDETAEITVNDWYEGVENDQELRHKVSRSFEGDAWADVGIFIQQIQARHDENNAVPTHEKRVNNPTYGVIMNVDLEDVKKRVKITGGLIVGTFILSKVLQSKFRYK